MRVATTNSKSPIETRSSSLNSLTTTLSPWWISSIRNASLRALGFNSSAPVTRDGIRIEISKHPPGYCPMAGPTHVQSSHLLFADFSLMEPQNQSRHRVGFDWQADFDQALSLIYPRR